MKILKFLLTAIILSNSLLMASDAEEIQGVIALTQEQIAEAHIENRTASSATLQNIISVPAKIVVDELRQEHVVAKASGIVAKTNKNLGDPVHANEILAVLESKEMAEAKAAYLTALKREALAAQTLKGEEILKNKQISSEQDYLHAALAAKEAQINLEVAAQQLFILGMDSNAIQQLVHEELSGLRNYEIKSSLDGVVIAKDLAIGELVAADQEVFMIADLEHVWVQMGIYPNDLSRVKPGNKVYVNAINGELQQAEGTVMQVSPMIDEDTRKAVAIASLPNSSRNWFPGSYVTADVVIGETQVPVAVLKDAIHEIDGQTCLFVPHPEGYEKREVTTGMSDNHYVEIIAGLEPEAPYAATHTFLLKAELGKEEAEL